MNESEKDKPNNITSVPQEPKFEGKEPFGDFGDTVIKPAASEANEVLYRLKQLPESEREKVLNSIEVSRRIDLAELESKIAHARTDYEKYKHYDGTQAIEYATHHIDMEREKSKNEISRLTTRFFAIFILVALAFICVAPILAAFGVPVEWKPASEALLEIIKIAVLPVAMLVLGFHFGSGEASLLKSMLKGLLAKNRRPDKSED